MHHIITLDAKGVIARHNHLVAEMADCAKEAGHHYVAVERVIRDSPDDETNQLRADIQLNNLYQNVTTDLDVTVVDPQLTSAPPTLTEPASRSSPQPRLPPCARSGSTSRPAPA